MERFIATGFYNKRFTNIYLKSSMERFIVPSFFLISNLPEYLKSSMERFIACNCESVILKSVIFKIQYGEIYSNFLKILEY